MTWWDYLVSVAGGTADQKEIAQLADVQQATVSRWKSGEIARPKAEAVIAVARRLGRPPAEALAAAGYLRDDELDVTITQHPVMTNAQLLELLAERLGEEVGSHGDSAATTQGAAAPDRDIESAEGASVNEPGQLYTLEGRRRRAAERPSEGPATVPEQRAVANEDETIATEGEAQEEQP